MTMGVDPIEPVDSAELQPGRQERVVRRTILVAACLLLVGCDPTSLVGREPVEDATQSAGDCTDDVRDVLGRTIDAQLHAFRAEDWDGALEFATDDFREGFDAARFREVIEAEFPVVAANVERSFGPCAVSSDDEAQFAVTVMDADGATQALAWLLSREAGIWRIGGAVPLDADPEDDGPLI